MNTVWPRKVEDETRIAEIELNMSECNVETDTESA